MDDPGGPESERILGPAADLASRLLPGCTFPAAPTTVACAFSGGVDSTALLALAQHAGHRVTAHHVDHGIRPESAADAVAAAAIAERLGVPFVLHRVTVEPGPNLEARARDARLRVLPAGVSTGHTADDQAETVLMRLLRGSGSRGLSGIEPGHQHPILAVRRAETEMICRAMDIEPVRDRSNQVLDAWRNRIRAELLPLAADIAGRDIVPILERTADHLRRESDFLDGLAGGLDPTDAISLANAPTVLAHRALRLWLAESGYPPDSAAIDRVLAVARGEALACEISGGRRVERRNQRLQIVEP